jgi:hypothetical protein
MMMGKNLEGSGYALIKVLPRHLPGRNEKNHEDFYVGFEVFTSMTMKNAVFWDVAPR